MLRPSPDLEPARGAERFSRGVLRRYEAEDLLRYGADGRIYVDEERGARAGLTAADVSNLQAELDVVLNLNDADLKAARRGTLDRAIFEVRAAHSGTTDRQQWSSGAVAQVLKRYENLDSEGRHREYCMIAVTYLKKKLDKHQY